MRAPAVHPAGTGPADAPVLLCAGLRRSFGELTAVDGVSFAIAAGETYGLLGPNGAGKTTTILMVAGVLAPDAGTVRVDGTPMTTRAVGVRGRIGYVPQEIAVYPDLTGGENLRFFARLYGLGRAAVKDRVAEVLDLIGLSDRAGDLAKTYSGGMQRRLNIGIGLLHRPHLLIRDEPTVGVDPQSRNAILRGVEALATGGMAVLYTTHYMEEAQGLCDRVGVVDGGRYRATADPGDGRSGGRQGTVGRCRRTGPGGRVPPPDRQDPAGLTMHAVVHIALKDLRQRLRDRSAVLIAVVLPLVLAFIESLVFGSAAAPHPFRYAVADLDHGPIAQAFTTGVLRELTGEGVVTVRPASDLAEATMLAQRGTVDAAFVVPAGFSAAVTAAGPARLEVIGHADSPNGTDVARAIAQSFTDSLTTVRVAIAGSEQPGQQIGPAQAAELAQRVAALAAPLALRDVSAGHKLVDTKTYVAAGMAVFFLFFTVQFGVSSLITERSGGTLNRLRAAPIRPAAAGSARCCLPCRPCWCSPRWPVASRRFGSKRRCGHEDARRGRHEPAPHSAGTHQCLLRVRVPDAADPHPRAGFRRQR